jgi:hypothetical protein
VGFAGLIVPKMPPFTKAAAPAPSLTTSAGVF